MAAGEEQRDDSITDLVEEVSCIASSGENNGWNVMSELANG